MLLSLGTQRSETARLRLFLGCCALWQYYSNIPHSIRSFSRTYEKKKKKANRIHKKTGLSRSNKAEQPSFSAEGKENQLSVDSSPYILWGYGETRVEILNVDPRIYVYKYRGFGLLIAVYLEASPDEESGEKLRRNTNVFSCASRWSEFSMSHGESSQLVGYSMLQ